MAAPVKRSHKDGHRRPSLVDPGGLLGTHSPPRINFMQFSWGKTKIVGWRSPFGKSCIHQWSCLFSSPNFTSECAKVSATSMGIYLQDVSVAASGVLTEVTLQLIDCEHCINAHQTAYSLCLVIKWHCNPV